MKTTLSTIVTLLAAASIVPATAGSQETHGDPYTPVGSLNVSKRLVRTGVKPVFSWSIKYPTSVFVVEIDPTGSINPRQDVLMEVRVVGAAFQSGETHLPVALKARVGESSSWQTMFNGIDHEVDASNVPLRQVVSANTKIDFTGSSYELDGSTIYRFGTATTGENIQVLTNGASIPDYVPAYNQDTINSFLTQYISADNTVTIGPRDLIILFELGATDQASSAYDMQDIVAVVTFKDVPRDRNGGPLAAR